MSWRSQDGCCRSWASKWTSWGGTRWRDAGRQADVTVGCVTACTRRLHSLNGAPHDGHYDIDTLREQSLGPRRTG